MNAATQVLAHRAQVSRTKPRWQPYTTTPKQMHHKSPATTPIPSPRIPPSSNEPHRLKPSVATPLTHHHSLPSSSKEPPRDLTKIKFAAGLVDQAVHLLHEVWRPSIIPREFRPPNTHLDATGPTEPTLKQSQSLLSVVQPSLQGSPTPSEDGEGPLLPIRPFVHEVLRRSRTSGNTLQTALCYLEAIREKVTLISKQESAGIRNYFEPESRIMPATEAELAREAEFAELEDEIVLAMPLDEILKTVKVEVEDLSDAELFYTNDSSSFGSSSTSASSSLSSHASMSETLIGDCLPTIQVSAASSNTPSSPLLCPRRAFLASLILAAKFSQDKCYSNRAWAKLSGLPALEIGRCERALGQALDWRLWVGKKSTATSASTSSRIVGRSQSEGCILASPAQRTPFLHQDEPPPFSLDARSAPKASSSSPRPLKSLQRSSTLPADAFATLEPLSSTSRLRPANDNYSILSVDACLTPSALERKLAGPIGTQSHVSQHESYAATAGDCTSDVGASSMGRHPGMDDQSHLPYSDVRESASMAGYAQRMPTHIAISSSKSSPSTPTLTFSPSCTESSFGSQTIQVTVLEDTMLPSSSASSFNAAGPWATSSADNATSLAGLDLLANEYASGKHNPPAIGADITAIMAQFNHFDTYPWRHESDRVCLDSVGVF